MGEMEETPTGDGIIAWLTSLKYSRRRVMRCGPYRSTHMTNGLSDKCTEGSSYFILPGSIKPSPPPPPTPTGDGIIA